MNEALDRLARQVRLDDPGSERLRLEFGHACVLRASHLLEDAQIVDCLSGLGRYLTGALDRAALDALAAQAASLASKHQGSRSIDGCGHAAVSATYAVAHALAGKALQAADYAAYALIYGQGGYGAVADRESFSPEFAAQVECLGSLANRRQDS